MNPSGLAEHLAKLHAVNPGLEHVHFADAAFDLSNLIISSADSSVRRNNFMKKGLRFFPPHILKTTEIDEEETTLLRQAFMLNPTQSVYEYVTGHQAEIIDFLRSELGEMKDDTCCLAAGYRSVSNEGGSVGSVTKHVANHCAKDAFLTDLALISFFSGLIFHVSLFLHSFCGYTVEPA
uniref:Phosphotransferase n=1 Tax=Heterorhabditis bacteriophora TaxID=37862 RepID=A0A1I7WQ79_HETBA